MPARGLPSPPSTAFSIRRPKSSVCTSMRYPPASISRDPRRRQRQQHRPRQGDSALKSRPTKTLERVISKAGLGSRTQARSWIQRAACESTAAWSRIPTTGSTSTATGSSSTTSRSSRRDRVYILLYKPTGYITTFKDPEGRPTVYDLIADVDTFVSPVGRLDLDTSGLLILTNDTQFAERLTNPDHKVPKTYLVKCTGSCLPTKRWINCATASNSATAPRVPPR